MQYPPSVSHGADFAADNLHTDGGLTYRWYQNKWGKPLYAFGHGLSFSQFTYEWAAQPQASVSIASLKSKAGKGCYDCSALAFSVKVINTGQVAGDAVVLGFVVVKGALVGRALFDFGRVSLAAGASSVVVLRMDASCKQAISRVDQTGARFVEQGEYTITAGDIVAPVTHELMVTGESQGIDPHCR